METLALFGVRWLKQNAILDSKYALHILANRSISSIRVLKHVRRPGVSNALP